jgi:hypothetical protein
MRKVVIGTLVFLGGMAVVLSIPVSASWWKVLPGVVAMFLGACLAHSGSKEYL